MAVGAELEKFAIDSGKADDKSRSPSVYAKAGAKVYDLDDADAARSGRRIARDTAWKDYADEERDLRASC